ncbi:MAG: dipeptidyl-peptidase 3 family protein [Chlamydiota bacterium]
MKTPVSILLLMCALSVTAQTANSSHVPDRAELEKMAARFAPTRIQVDVSGLSAGSRQALVKLIEAARILNDIYMQQLWSGDQALYTRLKKERMPLGRARFHYFWINKGPWDELNEFKAFIPGVPERKPAGANFYPADMTREQFESWVKALPEKDQEQAKGFFTVIHWQSKGKLAWIPYSQEYRPELEHAAALLRQAATLTDNASLRKFLLSRAAAFLSNDYYQSDLDWMDLDSPLDITIGPYETYTDELLGYKAAFEAYVNLRDEKETQKLAAFAQHLQEIEDNLPEAPQYRRPKLGALAPIRVVDEILSAGDGAHGVQTAAYNLPNDERVVQQKGSKRVMLKNIQEAKFEAALIPISRRVLPPAEQKDVSFEMFFTHTVAHELMHGLGPQQIKAQGRDTSPRKELKELYSAIEEAKADVTGLFALQYMMDHAQQMGLTGVLPSDEAAQRQLYTTFLASAFRSIRFGLNEAHGEGTAVQLNYLLDKGGFVANPDGTFSVNMAKVKDAVRDLDHEFLTIEAEGNYAGAKQMLDHYGVIRPEVQKALDRLHDIPVDIEPLFVTADELAPVKTGDRSHGSN